MDCGFESNWGHNNKTHASRVCFIIVFRDSNRGSQFRISETKIQRISDEENPIRDTKLRSLGLQAPDLFKSLQAIDDKSQFPDLPESPEAIGCKSQSRSRAGPAHQR